VALTGTSVDDASGNENGKMIKNLEIEMKIEMKNSRSGQFLVNLF
jgi:hypothetical protein